MASINLLNPKAEMVRSAQALALNLSAARGIQDVMRSNLGPAGTMKMLVSGGGDVKITKDGHTLLQEMQIQHPTASLIARASTGMDDVLGDGSTTTVLLIAELLKQAELFISEGIHPRIIAEGFSLAKECSLKLLHDIRRTIPLDKGGVSGVCISTCQTKLEKELGKHIGEICLNAMECIYKPSESLDLHMVEIMTMQHQTEQDTTLVRGLVLDHGSRHPNMPKIVNNAYILVCNISLEYEKTEVNSGFFYKTAEEREKLVLAERDFIKQRVDKIIALKKKVCDGTEKGFVVINQKGIDPFSLDLLARENIMALRRAKRRNMERLSLACGGAAVNSLEDLEESCLGEASRVYEHVLGETKYTFVEDCKACLSVTILIKGPNTYTINLMKDAVHDGLRAIKNALDDGATVPGCGSFEVSAHLFLMKFKDTVVGKAKFGIQAFAEALLIVPKVLASNAGHDPLLTIAKVVDQTFNDNNGVPLGFDIYKGKVVEPYALGLHDNYCVKKQALETATVIASNLLLVDEIMRAGLSSLKG